MEREGGKEGGMTEGREAATRHSQRGKFSQRFEKSRDFKLKHITKRAE